MHDLLTKMAMASLIAGIGFAAAGPADAKLSANGTSLNGTSLNGTSVNGLRQSAFNASGGSLNGIQVEGIILATH